MIRLVIDASVAIKWVVTEQGSAEADALLSSALFAAPDLIAAECANILWKKARRGEMTPDAALVAARALELVDIELRPMKGLIAASTRLAIDLGHPAHDCCYFALAAEQACPFVTADEVLARKVSASKAAGRPEIFTLLEAAARLAP